MRRTTPCGDHAARDRAEPGDPEERAHLGLADRLLRRDGGELADQRLLDLLGQLVDDVVGADLDALPRRELARLGVRTHVEAHDESVGGGREHDVVLGDRPHALGDHVQPHLRVLELRQLRDDGLDRADDVAADDQVEVRDVARLERLVQALERDAAARADGRELFAAEPLAAPVGEVARLTVVGDDTRQLTRRRRLVEAEDLDGIARDRALPALALVVEQRLDAAVRIPCDHRVAHAERPAVDEHGRDRAARPRRAATR